MCVLINKGLQNYSAFYPFVQSKLFLPSCFLLAAVYVLRVMRAPVAKVLFKISVLAAAAVASGGGNCLKLTDLIGHLSVRLRLCASLHLDEKMTLVT